MTVDEALQDIELLGIDTSPFIYFAEEDTNYYTRVVPVFERFAQNRLMGCTSVLTLTETLVYPLRNGDQAQVGNYRQLLMGMKSIMLLHITDSTALRAADLRARYRLKTPDAIQIATAIAEGCEAFLTNDRDLRRVTEISVLVLEDLTL